MLKSICVVNELHKVTGKLTKQYTKLTESRTNVM